MAVTANRKAAITIDHTKIDADLPGAGSDRFTVVLTQAVLPSEMFDADGSFPAQNGGGDIRFSSDADGNTQLACDVRVFTTDNDPANGVADIAVGVPSISATVDTVIYVWYNTATTDSQPAASDTYGQYNAYDASVRACYPLTNAQDRTQYARHGTVTGATTTAGAIAGAYNFVGASDHRIALATGLAAAMTRPFTLSALIKADEAATGCVASLGSTGSASDFNCFRFRLSAGKVNAFHQTVGGVYDGTSHSVNIPDDTWCAAGWNFVNATTARVVLNGALESNAAMTSVTPTNVTLATLGLLRTGTTPVISDEYTGLIDEVMFITGDMSEAWHKARYYNHLAPTTFASAGTPESPSSGTVVSVPTASLTLTAYAPSVVITENVTVAVPAASLTLTGHAPVVTASDHKTVAVPAASLSLSGFAPTVAVSEHVSVAVPAGSLSLTGFAPTVAVTEHVSIAVPAGSVTLTGFAPTVAISGNQAVDVPAGALALTVFAPTVSAGSNVAIEVPAGELTLTGHAPTVSATANRTIAVPAGSLTLTGYEPAVVTGGNRVVQVPKGQLTLTGHAPTVAATAHITIAVPSASLSLTGFAPVVTATDQKIVAVPAGSLTLTVYAPTVSVSSHRVISVPAGSMTLTGHAPTVSTTATISIPSASLTLTGYAPSVSTAYQGTVLTLTGHLHDLTTLSGTVHDSTTFTGQLVDHRSIMGTI